MLSKWPDHIWERSPGDFHIVDRFGQSSNRRSNELYLSCGKDGVQISELMLSGGPPSGTEALFRQFADTPPTPEGIVAFANQYGFLGLASASTLPSTSIVNAEWDPEVWVEPLRDWQDEIEAMRDATTAWDLVVEGERLKLSRFLREHPAPPLSWLPNLDIVREETVSLLLQFGIDAPEFERRMKVRVEKVVNDRLRNRVSPRLSTHHGRTPWTLSFEPMNLIGAIWLQLAEAIDGEREQRRCKQCDTWMEIHPGKSRADRKYCSDSCRNNASQRRKRQAKKLHRQGKSILEIASELGSEPETVERWLATPKTG